MSLLNDASLILVPSAIKTGEVLVQKPLPNKFADETGNYDGNDPQGSANLTFTRASSATRVGPDGLIEKVRTNLLTQSEEFTTSNGWFAGVTGGSTATQTSNYGIAPNGTTTADRIQLALNGEPYADWVRPVSGFVIGQSYTYSIYLKSLTGSTNLEFFNDGASNVLKTITTEWVRYSHSFTASSATIYPRFLLGVTTSSTADLLAWGYQLETGDIATDYIATTTAAVSVGPVANLPRLDYLGSSCGKLLLEGQRTNLVTFSEQMDNAAWNNLNTTLTANAGISPDGYQNADKVIPAATSGAHIFFQSVSALISSGTTYTYSFFAKAAEYTKAGIRIGGAGYAPTPMAAINLSTGAIISQQGFTSVSVVSYGNGWYRIAGTYVATSAAAPNIIALSDSFTTTSDNYNFTGDGTSGILAFGAMHETGAYATSYIPTLGAAVTRLADAASKTGISSLIGQTEGTIFWEGSIDNFANYATLFALEGTSNSWIYCLTYSAGLTFEVRSNNVVTAGYSPTFTTGSHKIALAYNASQVAIYIDGVSVFTDNSVTIPATSNLYLAGWSGYNQAIKTAQALLFKTRLPNSSLEELTTL